MIAEECWALTIVKASPSRLTVPPMFMGSNRLRPWVPRYMQISNMATTVAPYFCASRALSPR
jgi:hypothetical protein